MYKRQITINPSHPEVALPAYSIGMRSAGILVIDGIPQGASDVRILVTKPQISGAAFQFDGRKVGGRWEIAFPQDEFLTVGEGTYELDFTMRSSTFWSSRGKFVILETYNGGIVPPSPIPGMPHTVVVSVNDLSPDEEGNVDLTPVLKPILDAIAAIKQVPDLSDLCELMPADSDRATKNLINAMLHRLKEA